MSKKAATKPATNKTELVKKTSNDKAEPVKSEPAKEPAKTTGSPPPPQPNFISSVFPTLIGVFPYKNTEKMNAELKAALWEKRAKDPKGNPRSNVGGTWHSADDLLTTTGKAGQALSQLFAQAFAELARAHGAPKNAELGFKLAAWAMIYPNGGYSTVHTHPNCHFSGVYWATGTDEEAVKAKMAELQQGIPPGCLEFVDNRGMNMKAPNMNLTPAHRIVPQPGLMAVFPSWLQHFVHPHFGLEDRISVACNATLAKVTPNEKKETK